MPSFDVVSEIDSHELANAVDQANREVSQRFDFRDTGANFELGDHLITLHAQVDFQLKQMLDILKLKLAKHRNGPTGEIGLWFKKKQTRFVSYAGERFAEAG